MTAEDEEIKMTGRRKERRVYHIKLVQEVVLLISCHVDDGPQADEEDIDLNQEELKPVNLLIYPKSSQNNHVQPINLIKFNFF